MKHHLTLSNGSPISRFAYGAMQWGARATDVDAQAMYDAARDADITHFDTAHVYSDGASETLLGVITAKERDALYIATKGGAVGGCSAANLRSQFDQSRLRLGMDQIDLYYLHRFDPDTPFEESFEALADLQSRGLIRHIGVSNFAAWQVVKANNVAAKLGTRIDVVQPMLNLVKRQVEVEILPMAQAEVIAVATYSPLAGGLLTGKYAGGNSDGRLTLDASYKARYGPKWMHEAALNLARIGHRIDVDPATLAIAWIVRHSPTVLPILSGRTLDQLKPSLSGMGYPLTDDLYAQITALAPTPAPATDRLEEL